MSEDTPIYKEVKEKKEPRKDEKIEWPTEDPDSK